ncbi:MAG TPA: sugar phosphate isomerase/epimerase family protein, partial [Spirochaetia bacterium]|nr:sugar phosphate isomerase/epimerase family protein [Spirochaetia bacterium]
MLSCSTVSFDGYEVAPAIEEIGKLGFDGVELGFIEGYVGNFSDELFGEDSARRVRAALGSAGLPCTAVSGHIDLSDDNAVERAALRLRFAARVGAPRLVTNAAIRLNEEAFFRNMEPIIREAERWKVIICLENPGNGVGNVIDGGVSAGDVMKRIGHPLVRINYDFANTASHAPACSAANFRSETDFIHTLPWLEQLHLKDVRRTSSGDFEYPAIGEGCIDFRSIFLTL